MSTETDNRNASSNAFWRLSWAATQKLGLEPAVLLADIIKHAWYFSENNLITEYGFFYKTAEQIEADTTIKCSRQRKAFKTLKDNDLIEIKLHGMPGRRYYKLVPENITTLLFSSAAEKKEKDLKAKEAFQKMKYADFLKTPYWKEIGIYIRQLYGNKCSICSYPHSLQVHHTTYKNHGDELHHLEDLVLLCRKCHKNLHLINGGVQ